MNLDLTQSIRFFRACESYERSFADVFADEVCRSARPVLPLLGYEGPDADVLFRVLDAISTAVSRCDPKQTLVVMRLEDARRAAAQDAAAAIVSIVTKARRIAEEDADRDLATDPANPPTNLQTTLQKSTNANAPKVAALPLRSVP
jgi:hypothetical protein